MNLISLADIEQFCFSISSVRFYDFLKNILKNISTTLLISVDSAMLYIISFLV